MAVSEPAARVRWRVLVTAPSTGDVDEIMEFFTAQGCAVTRCVESQTIVSQVALLLPQLVIVAAASLLDVLDACRAVRTATTAPMLVIGQQDLETDEILSLEYGADAYVPVGSSQRKVRAHLTAMLRRVRLDFQQNAEKPIQFGAVRIDAARRRVYRGDREVDLSHKEYALLLFLVDHAGRTVSRQDLSSYVWGAGGSGESRSLDVHIHWLREKLEADASNPQHIRTVRGIGYSFEP
ncbi:MAG: two component transcriptional regulator, winged helix family [Chloroflexi bacterium]|nr:two component transcriptional regulator, winged helix family [Chloroflexota bacterium]